MKKITVNKIFVIPGLILISLLLMQCKGTSDSGGERQRVIVLIDRDYLDGGRYGIFWDGKDSKRQYIKPGNYIYQMEAPDFQDAKRMTAIAGGKEKENFNYAYVHIEPYVWSTFELGDSTPEPFEINAGVVIPIQVKGEIARITITILKE